MIWFPMSRTDRPPSGFGEFGVEVLRYAGYDSAPVIRIIYLFSWLDELDIELGDGSAI